MTQKQKPATHKHIGQTVSVTGGISEFKQPLLAIVNHRFKYVVSDFNNSVYGVESATVPDIRPEPGEGFRLLANDFWKDVHEDIVDGDEWLDPETNAWKPTNCTGKNDGTLFYRRRVEQSLPIKIGDTVAFGGEGEVEDIATLDGRHLVKVLRNGVASWLAFSEIGIKQPAKPLQPVPITIPITNESFVLLKLTDAGKDVFRYHVECYYRPGWYRCQWDFFLKECQGGLDKPSIFFTAIELETK